MPLHDMPKRLVPFPLVITAIVGFFLLGVLYFDLRGKEERQAVNTPPDAGAAQELPPPNDIPTPTNADGETPPPPQPPKTLGLPPEVPTSDVPAAAVFDCWRYEWRDDRLIVDRDYRHIAGENIEPLVGPDTAHLRCQDPQYAERSDDGAITVFWSGTRPEQQAPAGLLAPDTLYAVDQSSGELTMLATIPGLNSETDVAVLAVSPTAIFLRTDSSRAGPWIVARVDLEKQADQLKAVDLRSYSYAAVPLWELTPDRTRAVGFELFEGRYLHRLNLSTGNRVRTRSLPAVYQGDLSQTSWRPVFIDDERLVVPGQGSAAVVVNVYTGATARIRQISGTTELLALTADGTTLYTYSDTMSLTALPVSELPKP